MIETMPVHIQTAAEAKGPAWAAKYPSKATELYVVARAGKRKKVRRIGPDTPENRARAESKAAEWRVLLEGAELSRAGIIALAFDDAAEEYRRAGMKQHAWKTRDGRKRQHLRAAVSFGDTPLDRIDATAVVAHYDALRAEGLADRTAQRHLDAISKVFQHHETPNPVPDARTRIARRSSRTAETRALDAGNCNPVPAEATGRLLAKLEGDALTVALLCYEAGLRIGEATGLRWEDVTFGADESDTARSIHVHRSRVGNRVGRTKSGVERRVALSRRLRRHLMARFMAVGRPARGYVVAHGWHKTYHEKLARAATRAKVPKPLFKDLRDTYASTLITHGIVLKWISIQLGHRSVAVTERHYARYMAVDGYQNPWRVPAGCLPSDLFAELDGWGVTTSSPSVTTDFGNAVSHRN